MGTAPPATRNLFKAAMVIFVITVVIGILNGTDVWDVPRDTLLAHVHAGTLGWITLGVLGASIWMFGSPDDHSADNLARYAIFALALYVLGFWSVGLTTTSIQRPIGGSLAFIAMTWMFIWAMRRKRGSSWNVAEMGMGLALAFAVGLIAESAPIKRVFTPILGLGLLYGIYTYLTAPTREAVEISTV
ncbi:MAG: hypothetical protein WBZ40_08285 [Acidimicrobiia bacterium]